MRTSQFGYPPSYESVDTASTASTALAVSTLATPNGITFSNGTNVWRVRMETDNNLTFSYSTDGGETFTVKHVFTPS